MPYQFGYRSKSNTEVAMVHAIRFVYEAVDSRKATFLTWIDLSRAFDSINHDFLLSKLSKLELSSSFMSLMSEYLSDRNQSVRIKESLSEQKAIYRETPQGGVLSGFLFNYYIQSLSMLSLHSQFTFYADDLRLVTSADNTFELKSLLEPDLSVIKCWLEYHEFAPNANKILALFWVKS